MKSQPEIQIRRLAVFGGVSSPDPTPAFSRISHGQPAPVLTARGDLRLADSDEDSVVIQLTPAPLGADLYRAA